jgi:hypothetical protein
MPTPNQATTGTTAVWTGRELMIEAVTVCRARHVVLVRSGTDIGA